MQLRGVCGRCVLADRLATICDDGTGRIAPHLQPLADRLLAMPRPRTGILWLDKPHVPPILEAIATGVVPLTHDGIATLSPTRSVNYIRQLLTAVGTLPGYDHHLDRFERWLPGWLDSITDPDQQATPHSVAAHSMYERTNPFIQALPGGILDMHASKYEAQTDRICKVTGSLFVPSPDGSYKVKLEGAGEAGHRVYHLVGIRDTRAIAHLDQILADIRERDHRDSTRAVAPLKKADDAIEIVSDNMTKDQVIAELVRNLPALIKRYPSSNPVVSARHLAAVLKVDPQYLIVGNGATELITELCHRLVPTIGVPIPTFGEYIEKVDASRLRLYPLQAAENYQLDLHAYLAWLRREALHAALQALQPAGRAAGRAGSDEPLHDHPER